MKVYVVGTHEYEYDDNLYNHQDGTHIPANAHRDYQVAMQQAVEQVDFDYFAMTYTGGVTETSSVMVAICEFLDYEGRINSDRGSWAETLSEEIKEKLMEIENTDVQCQLGWIILDNAGIAPATVHELEVPDVQG